MIHSHPSFKVAAAHVAPVFLDTQRTVDKACATIAEAARAGAKLVAFPETFIPAFPVWAGLVAPILIHDLFEVLASAAIEVEGVEMAKIRETARQHEIFVSIGFNEGTKASVGCVWNANAFIGDDGTLLNHHRKIVPTFCEKLVWANGDGAGLRVVETSIGRVGMLICGENTNPLARFTLMAQGEQLHISTYPPVWPTRPAGEAGGYDLEQAIRIRAGAHAFEAKAFNVVASACVDKTMRTCLENAFGPKILATIDSAPKAVSMVLGPTGLPVSEVASGDETILYADIDLSQCVEPKQFHDVAGGYNRFDIFKLQVDRSANRPVTFLNEEKESTTDKITRPMSNKQQSFQRISADVKLGSNVRIYDFTNLYGCEIGDDVKIGTFVEVQKGAKIGNRCKISSHTFICEGVTIEDEVFIGHNVTFINDRHPRATSATGELQSEADWTCVKTLIKRGASIGSGATLLCGITVGENALIGAGSVVTRDVPPGAIVAGNPARLVKSARAKADLRHNNECAQLT